MTVFKLDNGNYRTNVYFGPLGKHLPAPLTGKTRLTKVFDTRQAAKQQEREWEDLKAGLRSGAHGGVTIREWHHEWIRQPRRKTTEDVYRYATQRFVDEHANTLIAEWTVQQARWDAARRTNSQVKYIKTMFAEAIQRGLIDTSPYADVKTKRKDVKQTKADYHAVWPIDPQQQVELLTKILDTATRVGGPRRGAELRGKIAFAAWTGARPGEIRGLHRQDLDTAGGFATIKRVIDATGSERDGTKTGLHRKIFVPRPALEEVAQMPVQLNEPYVFTNQGKPWKDVTFYNWWRLIREKADLGQMRFYDMRHFCATQLLEMGVSPEDVAAQLGHSDGGALVREVYGHPSHDRALERIRYTTQQHTPKDSSQPRHTEYGKGA